MNCLAYALNAWHTDGGYLVLRATAHPTRFWRPPHALHIGPEGIQHFAPGATLGHPVQALVGFDGVVWDRDMADAPPVPIRGIVVGSLILAVGATGWAIGRLIRRAWRG